MATTELPTGSILGHAVKRTEDPRFLTGEARYVEDLEIEGVLEAVFLRSPLAHASISNVDTSEAEGMPGVVAVYTANNLGMKPRTPMRLFPREMARPFLAKDFVRFVGDAIAVVIAETRAQAVDAAETILVDYDPLPSVTDPVRSLEPDSPVIYPEHGSNLAAEIAFDTDPSILDESEVVVSARLINQRVAAVPMEVQACAALIDPDTGGLLLYASTQSPHGVKRDLARTLEMEEEKLRVIAPAVGGGFGAKGGSQPEYAVVSHLVRTLERPIRWVPARSENMVTLTHGRGQVQDAELGAKRDGTLMALRVSAISEAGAYPGFGGLMPFITRTMASGVYRIPKIEFNAKAVVTNTTPTSAYRGAGRPEAAALIERMVDILADEIGMDPVEIRRRNFIPKDAFPYTTAIGTTYDTGDYEAALDEALKVAGYEQLRKEQQDRRDRGDVKQLGIGVSSYVEVTGGGAGDEFGSVEVHHDGTVTVLVGTSAHGQGHETAYAQIVSELTAIPMEKIRIIQSDTALVPKGGGTAGSRSLQMGGSAIYQATGKVVEKAKELAAHLLEASPQDIVVEDSRVGIAGAPTRSFTWAKLAETASGREGLPEGMEPGLIWAGDWEGQGSFPFGCHIAVVEVDMETGEVRLVRHIAVDDCGTIVNPLLVEGQVHGGITQGVAQALFEAVLYDENGNPLTGNLMNYTMPSAAELPSFETAHTQTPTPNNPLGAKGVGEAGTIGSTPAVQNAVVDALSHLGVRHLDMPASPERVWRAIQEARSK